MVFVKSSQFDSTIGIFFSYSKLKVIYLIHGSLSIWTVLLEHFSFYTADIEISFQKTNEGASDLNNPIRFRRSTFVKATVAWS